MNAAIRTEHLGKKFGRIEALSELNLDFGACVVVIFWQYARRRTLLSRLLLAVAAGIVLVTMTVTPHRSFDAHAYPQISSGQRLPVQLTFDPASQLRLVAPRSRRTKVYVQVRCLFPE